jgi:putative chitinase
MELTLQQLQAIIGNNPYIEHWYEALSKALPDYEINTPQRLAAWFGETKVESANYTAIKENLNYKPESLVRLWHSHFPSMDVANQYAHNPEAIANRAYGGRMGNGDEASGDGWRFCGRGLIQLTGRTNYQAFADSLQISVDDAAQYLETFEGCVQSACWFWENNNLNALADQGNIDAISKKVNGGTEGLEQRRNFYQHALQVLS